MNFSPEWLLIYLGLLAICLELLLGVSTGFDMVVVGSSLLVGGAIGVVLESWQIGLGISLVLAVAYVAIGRNYLRKSLTVTTSATNVDRLIGKTVQVVKSISAKQAGQVELEGETWRAVSEKPIKNGREAIVLAVEGVTLNVVESEKPKVIAKRKSPKAKVKTQKSKAQGKSKK